MLSVWATHLCYVRALLITILLAAESDLRVSRYVRLHHPLQRRLPLSRYVERGSQDLKVIAVRYSASPIVSYPKNVYVTPCKCLNIAAFGAGDGARAIDETDRVNDSLTIEAIGEKMVEAASGTLKT